MAGLTGDARGNLLGEYPSVGTPHWHVTNAIASEQQPTGQQRSWQVSVALTDGQGIPDQTDQLSEGYNSIIRMTRTALADNVDTDPDRSVLANARVKLSHPTEYSRGSYLEEFKVFVTGIL